MSIEKQGPPKVTKFKFHKKGKDTGVEVAFVQQYVDDKQEVITVKNPGQFHAVEVHADLAELWKKLSLHYALATEREEHDDSTLASAEEVERCAKRYPVGSVQWKEGAKYVGVQFHGHMVLSTGHAVPSLTRLIKFNIPSQDYPLADQLQELTDAIRVEVVALLNGKHAKPAQQSITDPDQQVHAEEEVDAEA